eukprot:2819592-Prymnesium_polylepis.1
MRCAQRASVGAIRCGDHRRVRRGVIGENEDVVTLIACDGKDEVRDGDEIDGPHCLQRHNIKAGHRAVERKQPEDVEGAHHPHHVTRDSRDGSACRDLGLETLNGNEAHVTPWRAGGGAP